jgi:hypothetical protein
LEPDDNGSDSSSDYHDHDDYCDDGDDRVAGHIENHISRERRRMALVKRNPIIG